MYWRAFGSAITKRSLYDFVQKHVVGYQARDAYAKTSVLIPDGAILAREFEPPISDFILM